MLHNVVISGVVLSDGYCIKLWTCMSIMPVFCYGHRTIFAESKSAIFRRFRASHLAVGCEMPCGHNKTFDINLNLCVAILLVC